jgi:hypothetical protein
LYCRAGSNESLLPLQLCRLPSSAFSALVVAAGVFLPVNGYQLIAADAELVSVMLSVAEGSMPEKEFAAWLRTHMQPRHAPPKPGS